jgi:hypothetical protein
VTKLQTWVLISILALGLIVGAAFAWSAKHRADCARVDMGVISGTSVHIYDYPCQ